jgi:hypothetical protein
MTPWCAPDRSAGTHRLDGKVPVRRGISVAAWLYPDDLLEKTVK